MEQRNLNWKIQRKVADNLIQDDKRFHVTCSEYIRLDSSPIIKSFTILSARESNGKLVKRSLIVMAKNTSVSAFFAPENEERVSIFKISSKDDMIKHFNSLNVVCKFPDYVKLDIAEVLSSDKNPSNLAKIKQEFFERPDQAVSREELNSNRYGPTSSMVLPRDFEVLRALADVLPLTVVAGNDVEQPTFLFH